MFFLCYNIFGDIMKNVLKIAFIVIGGAIFTNGALISLVSNLNAGNFFTLALGILIIFTSLFFEKLTIWLRIALLSPIAIAVVFSSFLIIYGKTDIATYQEDAIIVLGAAVHGKTPSLTLRHRLDKAVNYHQKNPQALIIVSGGQGAQEEISEAEAMEIYLIKNGVNPDKIIREDRATSTYENFLYSKDILETKLGSDYSYSFITNEYHVFRARSCAGRAISAKPTHLHSNTKLSYLLPGVLRECLAVVKYIVLKR